MKIVIKDIPHAQQRYPTCGDWYYDEDGTLNICVSREMGEDSGFLVALHELIECAFCKKHGVSQEVVDKFDKDYEANRAEGDNSEPGDNPDAPYHNEHGLAMSFERLLAIGLGVEWSDHEARIDALP